MGGRDKPNLITKLMHARADHVAMQILQALYLGSQVYSRVAKCQAGTGANRAARPSFTRYTAIAQTPTRACRLLSLTTTQTYTRSTRTGSMNQDTTMEDSTGPAATLDSTGPAVTPVSTAPTPSLSGQRSTLNNFERTAELKSLTFRAGDEQASIMVWRELYS